MSQTVIITGASRGIGRECAKQFKAAGYNVAAIYRQNDAAAESLRAEIGCEIFRCDCSVYSDVERTFKEIERIFGGADVLINNAGIADFWSTRKIRTATVKSTIQTGCVPCTVSLRCL